MGRPFIQSTIAQFEGAAQRFPWTSKTEIHVHHTWRPNHSQYRGLASIEGMYAYHIKEGFSDIAQHISIAPDGSIWSGRPWNASPASALGHNGRHVFMFETIGDFDVGKDKLQGSQLESVVRVIVALRAACGIGDGGVKFHNQMSSKTCPGSAVSKATLLDLVHQYEAQFLAKATPKGLQPPREVQDLIDLAAGPEAGEDPEGAEHPAEGDADYARFIETFGE